MTDEHAENEPHEEQEQTQACSKLELEVPSRAWKRFAMFGLLDALEDIGQGIKRDRSQ